MKHVILISVCIFAVLGVFILGPLLDSAQEEITPADYRTLIAVANKSCSGKTLLKERLSVGPIRSGNFVLISEELQRRAIAQESAKIRTEYTNTPPTCA